MLTKEDVVIILKIYNNQAQRVKGRILRTPQSSLAINGVSVTRCVLKSRFSDLHKTQIMKNQKIKHEIEIGDNLGCLLFIVAIIIGLIIIKIL